MGENMGSQVRFAGHTLLANVTFIRSDSGMCFDVSPEITYTAESSCTDMALVRFQSTVSIHMQIQLTFVYKSFTTVIALEGLHMCFDVTL